MSGPSVPSDGDVLKARDDARDAVAGVADRVVSTHASILSATRAVTDARRTRRSDEREQSAALHARCWPALESVAADPAGPQRSRTLRTLATEAFSLANVRSRLRRGCGDAAGQARANIDATLVEKASLPNDDAVRSARNALSVARDALASARSRLAEREREEQEARDQAEAAADALHAALLGAALPVDLNVPLLVSGFIEYRASAERWIEAGVESVRATGAATLAFARALNSRDVADQSRTEVNSYLEQHHRQSERLRVLTEDYGDDYADIVAELDQLATERKACDRERDELTVAERKHIADRARADADHRAAQEDRKIADTVRTEAGEAFLASHRVGLLTAAGLPDAPPSQDAPRSSEEESESQPPSGLGVRAIRTWARSVRDAAGDRLLRDSVAVEQAANKVNETRYNLEPSLSGRISIRDEQQSGLLVLYASRGVHTLPVVEMIVALGNDLIRDRHLLAADETELFRRFLADSTRREVTSKVRDARTQVREMADLMAAHPTGSGIQVRLRWVPDERNAPGMQDIVALMGRDAPLDSEKERLQEFFRDRVAQVRASADSDYRTHMAQLLDYRQWWRFAVEFRRGTRESWTPLTNKAHGTLSGGEKAVCLHLPLFAAAATYCNNAGVHSIEPDGGTGPGSPRLILLDEVFAGVDEDNRGELFDLIRDLDLDLVATSESEYGLYPQIDGLAIYQLYASDSAIMAARTVWDGRVAHALVDHDLLRQVDDPDLFTP